MKLKSLGRLLPTWQNALLAVLSAVLLTLAFPPFEWWFMAWIALVPLLWGIEREHCVQRSFTLGWLCGNIFFFATCWWLTFAPITYAGFPSPLAYLLLFLVTSAAAVFIGIFAAITSFLLNRLGSGAILAVPFVWVFTEFARHWLTGNNWNGLGYSQAFTARTPGFAEYGGVFFVGCMIAVVSSSVTFWLLKPSRYYVFVVAFFSLLIFSDLYTIAGVSKFNGFMLNVFPDHVLNLKSPVSKVIALQPSVPMSGLTIEKWQTLRRQHVRLAETSLHEWPANKNNLPTTVIFPESPMNFMYDDDPETQEFINGFAARNNVSVLFNSAEPDKSNGKYFNSAVLVGPDGKEVAQYDKIYLLPFGEAVPVPLDMIVPAFVGSFSYGKEYDLFPLGDAKAGVMICFESHFGQLSREYVRNGADVLIEMTNDGYLGPTPVLRQHLANAVFRAVETNRPVLRVTNVGITAYINERGEVLDAAEAYTEATRVWSVARSDGWQTFYVKFGDWFAWLCTVVTLLLVGYALSDRKFRPNRTPIEESP